MGEKVLNRLVICVDSADYDAYGTLGYDNASNIFRLRNTIAIGTHHDSFGRTIDQTVRYYQAVSDGRFRRLKSRSMSSLHQQIKDITHDVVLKLENPNDEVYLYGFGHGAYIVRAVAALLHFMGMPKDKMAFEDVYQKALALQQAHAKDDSLNGHYGTRNRGTAIYELNGGKIDGPGLVMGSHLDMGGGTQSDGLSLYPYQWMILESIYAGLILQPDTKEKYLELAFPQFMGQIPILGGEEKIEWKISYANDINVVMFDLHSLHTDSNLDHAHNVYLGPPARILKSQRKVWNASSKALLGWFECGPWGNIIHPSLFAILDRTPKMYDQGLFKLRKIELGDFQERCLASGKTEVQPWLEGLQLQASGVKAFRILVCGKTGVGKSTLINKVFGVEMTEESTTYSQGVHDINTAFESPNHPGLLIHDSRGWQAGSDDELDLIAKFLRHRAFQKDPAESLHVIWFCIDSDVSRIEEADKRTFETISQFSHHVPVFVVGTKKDKLMLYHKMQLLEQHMKQMDNYKEASNLATAEADAAAEEQFGKLIEQLSRIEHFKADGYCCISKDDDSGVRTLLNQTLDLLADERVRLFCVAAQVMDVEQKIDSAITECMRLGTHAIRTAMVPLPFSSMIGTPTVSRLICEHVLQCFGFPKAAPNAVEDIMTRVVKGNLKDFMKVSVAQFSAISLTAVGLAVPTMGIGFIVGAAGGLFASPPTARMLFKCASDMILILERSFRYQGKYVSVKQIEDAAVYYTTAMTRTFSGREVLLQQHVHDEVDRLIPLKKASVGWRFANFRSGLQDIVYMNRFDKKTGGPRKSISCSDAYEIPELEAPTDIAELDASPREPQELEGDTIRSAMELESPATKLVQTSIVTSGTPRPTRKFSWTNDFKSVKDPVKASAVTELDRNFLEASRGDCRKEECLFKWSFTRLTSKRTKSGTTE